MILQGRHRHACRRLFKIQVRLRRLEYGGLSGFILYLLIWIVYVFWAFVEYLRFFEWDRFMRFVKRQLETLCLKHLVLVEVLADSYFEILPWFFLVSVRVRVLAVIKPGIQKLKVRIIIFEVPIRQYVLQTLQSVRALLVLHLGELRVVVLDAHDMVNIEGIIRIVPSQPLGLLLRVPNHLPLHQAQLILLKSLQYLPQLFNLLLVYFGLVLVTELLLRGSIYLNLIVKWTVAIS